MLFPERLRIVDKGGRRPFFSMSSATNQRFRDVSRMACRIMLDLSRGKRPYGAVTREWFDKSTIREKWDPISLATTEKAARSSRLTETP